MSNYNRPQGQGFVTDSFSSDAGATKKTTHHTLRPVTIKQLLNVPQTDDLRLDNHDLGQVTFVGVVRLINPQSTQTTYVVEDGTGSIEVKRFPSDGDEAESNPIHEATYVRVVGVLKHFNQKSSVNAHNIRPVHDMNELTYHNLEALLVHVSFTRSKNEGMAMMGVSSTGGPKIGGSDIKQQIADMVHYHPELKTGGVHRRHIVNQFAPIVGGNDAINTLIDEMSMEGYLFEIDTDHFSSTY
ncbi:hypothetical protein B0O80DRAFT_455870 [Mortierella sp. GBAus27b]|nr:replication factor A protein 2 [Mortierella sp. GBA43]KAI8351702.1 hypothetical protein B0O80DRAFT_455870 [Mortierella sp. GBAus27b]